MTRGPGIAGDAVWRAAGPVALAAGLFLLGAWQIRTARADPPLAHTFETPEAVVAAVVDALARRDTEGLQALALSEEEFRRVVWPHLPSSRPEVNLPVEYAWRTLQQNSRASLAAILSEHGGRLYGLERLARRGETSRYPTFSVQGDVDIIVRAGPGTTRRLRLFGSLIQQRGRWKIFSYVVD